MGKRAPEAIAVVASIAVLAAGAAMAWQEAEALSTKAEPA